MADETTSTVETVETSTTETPAGDNSPQGNGSEQSRAAPKESPAEKAMRQLSEEEYADLAGKAKFFQDYLKLSQEDPDVILEDLLQHNPNARTSLEKRLAQFHLQEIEEANLTPEQRKLRELEAFKKQVEEEKAAKQKEVEEAVVYQQQEVIEDTIQKALEISGYEATPWTANLAFRAIELAIKNDVDFTPEDIAGYIEHTLQHSAFSKLDRLDGDALLQALGDNRLKKIADAYRQKAEKVSPKGTFTKPEAMGNKSDKKKGPMYVDERLRSNNGLEYRQPKMTSEERLRKLWRSED